MQYLEKYGGICDCQISRDSAVYAASADLQGYDAVVKLLNDVSRRMVITGDEVWLLFDRSIDWLIVRLFGCSICRLIDWLFDCLVVRSVDWLIDWLALLQWELTFSGQRVVRIFNSGCFLSLGVRSKASHQVRFGRLGKALRSGTDIDWHDSQGTFPFVFSTSRLTAIELHWNIIKIFLLIYKRLYLFLQYFLILQ